MKILFLDLDGVVNSARHFEVISKTQYRKARGKAKANRDHVEMIDPAAVLLLNQILERSGAKVVMSSSWRIIFSYLEIEAMLKQRGFVGEIIGATPSGISAPEPTNRNQRGTEIQAWLSDHPGVTQFVIIDDSDDMAHLRHRLVRTTWNNGIEQEHVEQAVKLFEES